MPSLSERIVPEPAEPLGLGGEVVGDGKARQGAHVSEMQRRRLLSAIVEVLDEHGLEGATVGRICKRAGVSRRTFYDLFDDREACFLDAFDHAIERFGEKIAPAYAGEGRTHGAHSTQRAHGTQRAQSWRERVRAGLVVLLQCFDAEPGVARLCLVETLKGGPEVLERRRAVTDALTVAIDEGRKEAKGADPPSLTAESAVGGAISIIHARLVACPPVPSRVPPAMGDQRPGKRDSRSGTGRLLPAVEGPGMMELVNPLMSMIVLPYLGPAASRKELDRPLPVPSVTAKGANGHVPAPASDPFRGLPIRITFRTVRVLETIGVKPDVSNREIGQGAGVTDQGQMSKLLRRLEKSGLIENHGEGQARGEPNAWRLTAQGQGVLHAVGGDA